MGVSTYKPIVNKRKKAEIPNTIWNSILASYNIYAKKYGYDSHGWMEYFIKRTKNGRRKATREWIVKNPEHTMSLLTLIGDYYEGHVKEKKPKGKRVWADYGDYLKSKEWSLKREEFIPGKSCEVCGTGKGLVLHHLRYKDDKGASILGREGEMDLVVLCWDCHTRLHNKYGRGASFGFEEMLEEQVNLGDEGLNHFMYIEGFEYPIVLSKESRDLVYKSIQNGDDFIWFADLAIKTSKIVMIVREDLNNSLSNISKTGNKEQAVEETQNLLKEKASTKS